MQRRSMVEFWVGVLMVLGVVALAFLALRVSGLSVDNKLFGGGSYELHAQFSDIGSLKVRAPVRVSGVEIGVVTNIVLDPKTYQASVTMKIEDSVNDLPDDTSARIASAGILGDNYISLTPGYSQKLLTNNGNIRTTYSATSIESLVSTFLGGSKSNDNDNAQQKTQ